MIREVSYRHRTFWLHDETEHTEWVLGQLDKRKWEEDTFDTIDRFVDGGVFVDVGAWIGLFTIYAAPFASHIYALEPDPVARDMLERNIAINQLDNVTVLPKALWSHDGNIRMFANTGLGDSMTGPRRKGDPITFPCLTPETLRGLVGENVDLVKVDTEGSEKEILPGIIEWPAPLHVSIHRHDIDGAELSFGTRPAEILPGGDHVHYTVLVL